MKTAKFEVKKLLDCPAVGAGGFARAEAFGQIMVK